MSSAWLIATRTLAAQDLTINASPQTIAAGTRYLYDATGSRSWLDALEDALVAAGVTTPIVFLTRARKVRITAGSSFSITWTDTELRDLLGFTGNLGSATSHTATLISPALWSPGYEATSSSPYGTAGRPVSDVQILSSPSGLTTTMIRHFTKTLQELSWDVVVLSRVWTSSELGGEFRRFYDDSLEAGEQIKHYVSVDEDDTATTTAATMGSGLGPYKLRAPNPDWYNRRIEAVDRLSRIDVSLLKVAEVA